MKDAQSREEIEILRQHAEAAVCELWDLRKQIQLLAQALGYRFEGSDIAFGVKILPLCKECGK